MTLYRDRETQYVENCAGGEGAMIRGCCLPDDMLGGKLTYAAHNTLEPHSTLGVHPHIGENETYLITSGSGMYHDNDEYYAVKAGDVLYCGDGSTHSLENPNDEPLTFFAFIQAMN